MLIQSHLFLSGKIKEVINVNEEGNLKSASFSMGSIIPDIHPDKRNLPHNITASLPFLVKKTEECIKVGKGDNELSSKNLGIITHFLADYFCLAHNDENMNLWEHMLYEKKLHKALTSEELIPSDNFKIPLRDIEEWVREKHNLYLNSTHTIEKDIFFIQEVCLNVTRSLVTATIAERERIPVGGLSILT
ncbi:Zinc dependent phospholipase C [Desulfonispora thiosulfatigenes DSM 11270]|uniref:Zinc dependent phospholipase C n=1 Tax=Desulfonispora thiosulfatigenes DSM 11270 TaxID=656914 RepID=A0A1W1V023_DESTI|nr:zinc dependent phospholipase C family protein [Desulfonispora thiosulfatigenes]SMB86705.1 Zinc dependent phospholipase C [Desulfonispora thiosulfatigenes DSM 11270]